MPVDRLASDLHPACFLSSGEKSGGNCKWLSGGKYTGTNHSNIDGKNAWQDRITAGASGDVPMYYLFSIDNPHCCWDNQMNRYLVQLDFISFIKFNALSFCCANTLFSPFNALFTFESSGIGRALLALLLAPFAGLLLGAVFGILAYPLYRVLTSRSEFLAALSGRFQEISDDTPEESLPDK